LPNQSENAHAGECHDQADPSAEIVVETGQADADHVAHQRGCLQDFQVKARSGNAFLQVYKHERRLEFQNGEHDGHGDRAREVEPLVVD